MLYAASRVNQSTLPMNTTSQLQHYQLGDTVTHVGSIGGMKIPVGIVTRAGKPNSLLSCITYGVTFPHGYFLIPADELKACRVPGDNQL